MLLNELIKNLSIKETKGDLNIEIDNISFDTRTVNDKSVFVCIKGINTDRHEFINAALEKGCKAIVAEYPVEASGVSVIVVADTNKALAVISSNFYGNPDKKLRIIGVTGTNGKTTTTMLIKKVLEGCGYKAGLIGTNDIIIGDTVVPSPNTTPEAPDLFGYFAGMVAENCDFAVMEVSSHSIALGRIYGIDFEAGLFTNLTQDHLDYHKTMENYAETKSDFFSFCDTAVINNDDEYADVMKKNIKNRLVTYSVKNPSDYKAVNVIHEDSGVSYDVLMNNKEVHIDFPIPGGFSVYNSLGVCALCEAIGIEPKKIADGLRNAETVKGRCELVPIDKPYKVIIDYAHTPDGMENILTTVNEFKKGRVICVFGCGGDRDKGKRPKMGAMGKKYSDIVVVTSDNPRSEKPESIIDDIMEGIKDRDNVYTEPDRKKAIKLAMSMAKQNDIVLLLGKGHETVQKFKDYNIEFDERKIVRELCDLV